MNFRCGRILCLLLFLPLGTAFAGGKPEKDLLPAQENRVAESQQVENQAVESLSIENRQVENLTDPSSPAVSRAGTIFRALAQAYPDRTAQPEFRDGDWTIEVYGERFYFAEGRMLPASLRDRKNEYDPLPFYNYLPELPVWKPPTPEESALIKEQAALRNSRQLKRSQHFYDALWRIHNREEAWEHVKQIRFLGYPTLVHYSILTQLSLVEEQILRSAKTNATVRQWIDNIKSVDGWSWRNIASTQSRSFHAYGAAIDFLPKSLGGLQTYWLWTAEKIPEWWTVPYAKRFQPPLEVIRAFESFGFIWGGKWRYYDTMHFEYRPEILFYSGIQRMDLRDLR